MKKDEFVDLSQSMSANVITLLNNRPQKTGFRGYLKSLISWDRETPPPSINTSRQCITERDFTGYINDIASGIGKLKKELSSKGERKVKKEAVPSVEESVKYIPTHYFQENSIPQLGRLSSKAQIRKEQQKLNEYLDTIEVCLFKHINVRFADFFKMLENIEYLEKAVSVNILILSQARQSIHTVKKSCVQKVSRIKVKSTEIQNKKQLQKLLILLKQVKNAGNLLKDGKEVSDSTLEILAHAKKAHQSLAGVKCIERLGGQLEGLVGEASEKFSVGIVGKILEYISVPLRMDFLQKMREVPVDNAMDSEAFVNETVLFDSKIEIIPISKGIPISQPKIQKQLGKILINVYSTICVKQIKALGKELIASLQEVSNNFKTKLNEYLAEVLRKQNKELRQQSNSILSELQSSQQTASKQEHHQNEHIGELGNIQQAADQVSMAFFSKMIQIHHESMKMCLLRLIGVLSCFMDEIYKLGIDQPELFKELIAYPQQLVDFINAKIFSLMSLKKVSKSTTLLQFHNFLEQLLFWQDSTRVCLSHPLFQQDYLHASDPIHHLQSKLSSLMSILLSTKHHLQSTFLQNTHSSVLSQLTQSLHDDSWVAVHNMPFHFMSIIYYILHGDDYVKENMNDSLWGERSKREMSILVSSRRRDMAGMMGKVDFKLLKNAIVVNRRHYRVTVCFLMFMEILEEYLKIQDLYPELKEEVIGRVNDIVEGYSNGAYELIVQGGALKLDKIKAKIITARHLCLSWSCLQLIQVLLSPITHESISKSRDVLTNHSKQVIKRLSGLIKGKVNQCISSLISMNLSEQHPCPSQHSASIVTAYRQMMEILQQHMPQESCKQVMEETIALVLNQYLGHLKTKGSRGHQEASFFIDDMKILEFGFKKELEQMKAMFSF